MNLPALGPNGVEREASIIPPTRLTTEFTNDAISQTGLLLALELLFEVLHLS